MTAVTSSRRQIYNATGGGYEAGRYGERHMEGYLQRRSRTLLSIIRDTFGDRAIRILEVGCGTGLSLDFLARNGSGYSLFGTDASQTMLQQAEQKARLLDNGARLTLGDATQLPFATASFDVLFATRFIHQFPHAVKKDLWTEFERLLRPEGLLIIEFYARPYHWLRYHLGAGKARPRDQYFSHFPSRSEVRDLAGPHFQMHPLRLAGERLLVTVLGENLAHGAAQVGGRLFGGALLDEYFVATRRS